MKVDAFASNLRGNSPSGVGESTEADSGASTVWAFGQDQGYNAANDYEENPDIIRGEMSFYNTPLTEKYSGAVYGALREIQEQCSVDFQVMCPNSSPFVNFDYLMGEFVSPIQEQYMFRRRKLSASAALNRFRSGAEYVAYLRSFYSLKFLPQLLHPLSAVMYRDEKSKRFVAAGSKGGGSVLASTQVDGKPKLSNKPRSYSSGRAMTGAPRHVHMGDTHRRLGAAPVAADAAAIDSAAVNNEPMQANAADIAVDNQQTRSSDNRAAAPNFAQLVLDFLHGRDVRLSLTSPFAVLGGHLVQLRPAPQYTQYTLARGGWGDDDDGGYYSYDDSAGADDDAAYYGYDDDAYYSYDDDGAAYYAYDDRAQVDQGEVADGDGGDSYDFYDASTGARADGLIVQARVRPQVQPAQVPAAVAGRWERELEVGDHHDHRDHDHHDHDHDHHHHDHDDGPSSGEGSSGGSSESEEHVHSWFWGGGKGSRGTSSEGDSSSSEGRSSTSASSDGSSSSSSEEHGAWHRSGSPVPPDRSFSGSLGFGEDGDMCLYRGMAQGRVSDPCVDAVSDLYQLRAQYWQESQQQQQGCGHHGMFLVLVVGLFAACLVRRCYAAKHQRKVRSLLTALHTHPALKATVEAETGVKVPVPHPPPSFCCSGQDGGRCNSRALTRFCKVAAVTVALLVLTFWVSLSSLHITGHIVHELDEHAPADPVTGEPQYTSPLFAFTILLGVCTAEITMIALAFRGIKACCDRNNNNCCPAQPSSSSGDQQPPALAGTPGAAQWLGRYVQRVAQRFGGSGGAHEGYVRLPGGEEYAGDNEVLLGARYTAPAAGNDTEMVTIARPAPVPAPAVATAPPQQQYTAVMVPVTAMPVNVVTMV